MSLYTELKRRNVFRVAAAYIVVGWLLLQVSDVVLGFIGAPDWVGKAIIALLLLGLVPSLAIAWIFEVGPDGIQRDDGTTSPAAGTHARRLDTITLVALVVVALMVLLDQLRVPAPVAEPRKVAPESAATAPQAHAPPTSSLPSQAPPRSVAVLPFANRSAEADTAYFVDGVHDDLITQLARNGDLKVISRTSVMEYRGTNKNLRQIGRELGVATVIEGGVQRAGNRVRINAQLIDTSTDEHLWAETFDRELTPENVFEIQAGIASAIAAALARTLGKPTGTPSIAGATVPTGNQHAYDIYLQARAIDYGVFVSTSQFDRGAALYRRAIAEDPQFALAMGELGRMLTSIYFFGARDPATREEARQWIDRALAIAPDEPHLHLVLADHLYRIFDFDGALRELEIAERGMPNGAEIFELRGWIMRRQGNQDEAVRALETAVALNPRSDATIGALIYTHTHRGDLAAVRLWGERLRALPSASMESLGTLPWADLALLGDTAAVHEFIAANPAAAGRAFDPDMIPWLAYFERRYDDALAAVAQLTNPMLMNSRRVDPPELLHAQILRAQGKPDEMRAKALAANAKLDTFLSEHPRDARAMSALGKVLAMLEKPEEARAAARAAVEGSQQDAAVGPNLMVAELTTIAMSATSEELAERMASYLALDYKPRSFDSIMLDPVFDAHRDHPAIRALARRYSRKPAGT